jgi:BetI-type transcriptional repressor, C-terminal
LLREEAAWQSRARTRFDSVEDSPSCRLRVVLEELAADYDIEGWIELWSVARRDPAAADVRQRIDDEFRALIEGIVREGQQAGEFADLPPADVALTLGAIVDGFTIQATLHDDKVNPGYMLSAFVDAAELLLDCELPPAIPLAPRGKGGDG